MRIAIMGAGAGACGVGGYYGAKLAASGNDVVFIARGAHLDAIRSKGFSLVGPAGDIHLPRAVATTPRPAGVVYHDPDLLEVARQGFAEAAAVARAVGIDLPADIVDQRLRKHQGFLADMHASRYHDLNRGKRLELDNLSGLVVRKGREMGVPTPVHSMACACLKPFIEGRPR
jgi:ketopantoate reductase